MAHPAASSSTTASGSTSPQSRGELPVHIPAQRYTPDTTGLALFLCSIAAASGLPARFTVPGTLLTLVPLFTWMELLSPAARTAQNSEGGGAHSPSWAAVATRAATLALLLPAGTLAMMKGMQVRMREGHLR